MVSCVDVLNSSLWPVGKCEAPSWREHPPGISASGPASLVHSLCPSIPATVLSGPCAPLLFPLLGFPHPPVPVPQHVTKLLASWSSPHCQRSQGTAPPCGLTWNCTPWNSFCLCTSYSNSGLDITDSPGSPAPGTRSGTAWMTVNSSEQWERRPLQLL